MSGFKVPTRSAPRPQVDLDELASFAAGAETVVVHDRMLAPASSAHTSIAAPKARRAAPWTGLDNKRRLPAFNMRFTASEQAKLKFISERCPESMHEFALKAIQIAIRDRLKQLGEEE